MQVVLDQAERRISAIEVARAVPVDAVAQRVATTAAQRKECTTARISIQRGALFRSRSCIPSMMPSVFSISLAIVSMC